MIPVRKLIGKSIRKFEILGIQWWGDNYWILSNSNPYNSTIDKKNNGNLRVSKEKCIFLLIYSWNKNAKLFMYTVHCEVFFRIFCQVFRLVWQKIYESQDLPNANGHFYFFGTQRPNIKYKLFKFKMDWIQNMQNLKIIAKSRIFENRIFWSQIWS